MTEPEIFNLKVELTGTEVRALVDILDNIDYDVLRSITSTEITLYAGSCALVQIMKSIPHPYKNRAQVPA